MFTPADVDGVTLGPVRSLVDLEAVPSRCSQREARSGTGGVDGAYGGVHPKASASTVEVRETLVRVAAMLLGLDNVRFSRSQAEVEGTLGGSAR